MGVFSFNEQLKKDDVVVSVCLWVRLFVHSHFVLYGAFKAFSARCIKGVTSVFNNILRLFKMSLPSSVPVQ